MPSLQSAITLQGNAADDTIIRRDPNAAELFRILEVSPSFTETPIVFNNLTIQGGFMEITDNLSQEKIHGAGIYHTRGQLEINQSRIIGNVSKNVNDFAHGGGIYSNASLKITSSIIADNVAYLGAGIYSGNKDGTAKLALRNAIVSGNQVWSEFGKGGGIYSMGLITVAGSEFTQNKANMGGAIATRAYPPDSRQPDPRAVYHAAIYTSTFSENEAKWGGAISYGDQYDPALPTGSIARSHFYKNIGMSGGAIYDASKQLDIENTTFAYNSARTICHVIISGDNPDTPEEEPQIEEDRPCGTGGAVMSLGKKTTIINTTIANNYAEDYAGGLHINDLDPVHITLGNVILTNNTTKDGQNDCTSYNPKFPIDSLGNNIITHNACIGFTEADLLGIDAELDVFVESDSPGKSYFPLLDSSPAIDSGNTEICPKNDQLGNPRDEACDIGAIESL